MTPTQTRTPWPRTSRTAPPPTRIVRHGLRRPTTNAVTYMRSPASPARRIRHRIDLGAVTVADTSAIDYESGTTCTIDVTATHICADGSTSDTTFTVTITDVDEFDVAAVTDTDSNANTLAEDVANGASAEIARVRHRRRRHHQHGDLRDRRAVLRRRLRVRSIPRRER